MWVKGTYFHPCSNKKPRPLSKIYVFILVFTFAIFLNETCNWLFASSIFGKFCLFLQSHTYFRYSFVIAVLAKQVPVIRSFSANT